MIESVKTPSKTYSKEELLELAQQKLDEYNEQNFWTLDKLLNTDKENIPYELEAITWTLKVLLRNDNEI